LAGFDLTTAREWFNGVKIGGNAIYNTYSIMSLIDRGDYDCFWGKSGALDVIISKLNDTRRLSITKLLNGEHVQVAVEDRISLRELYGNTGDGVFYSLLVQAGYLSLDERLPDKASAMVSIPNKELIMVWKHFILNLLYSDTTKVRTLFENSDYMDVFARDLEYFLTDRLSYHDLAVYNGEDETKTKERMYHIFVLGILSAYDDIRCKSPLSNRESGDGRFDILVEKANKNYIFEFKSCAKKEDMNMKAEEALAQIRHKRYGAEINNGKPLIKIGVAISGKLCKVRCE
jgi:hypothetical protein